MPRHTLIGGGLTRRTMAHSSAHSMHEPRCQTTAPIYSISNAIIMHCRSDPTTCQSGPLKFADEEAETENTCTQFVTKCVRRISCHPEVGPTFNIFQRWSMGSLEDKSLQSVLQLYNPTTVPRYYPTICVHIQQRRQVAFKTGIASSNQLPNSFHSSEAGRRGSAAISQH